MEKKIWRKHARNLLENMSVDDRERVEEEILHHLFSSTFWQAASTIGITLSRKQEWNTDVIIKQAWAEQKKVCVPKCYPESSQLVFYEFTNFTQLECVYLDLLEPKPEKTSIIQKNDIDLLFVPGLLFDRKGYRVGYGGGYYDRFLTDFKNNTLAIASESQMVEALPVEKFDLPVQHVITEKGLIF